MRLGLENLSNAQFSIFNSQPMGIEHWESTIAQILFLKRGSQVMSIRGAS